MGNFIDKLKLFVQTDKEFRLALYDILGFYPHNIELYRIAFAHKSQEYKSKKWGDKPLNNERLEFLGDAVLETVVSDIVYHRFQNKREGFLTNTRSKIVSRESLGRLAKELGLERLIQVGNFSRAHHSFIAGNAFEALMGAIYLDRGFSYAFRFIEKQIIGRCLNLESVAQKEVNFKSKLLEYCQKNRLKIHFNDKQEGDSTAAPVFITSVVIEGLFTADGKGYSKKEAQQNAAREALLRMRKEPEFEDSIYRSKEKRTAMEADPCFTLPIIDEIEADIAREAESDVARSAEPATSQPAEAARKPKKPAQRKKAEKPAKAEEQAKAEAPAKAPASAKQEIPAKAEAPAKAKAETSAKPEAQARAKKPRQAKAAAPQPAPSQPTAQKKAENQGDTASQEPAAPQESMASAEPLSPQKPQANAEKPVAAPEMKELPVVAAPAVPAPAQEIAAPALEASAPAQEVPAPALEASAPAQEVPAPALEASAPAQEVAAPTAAPAEPLVEATVFAKVKAITSVAMAGNSVEAEQNFQEKISRRPRGRRTNAEDFTNTEPVLAEMSHRAAKAAKRVEEARMAKARKKAHRDLKEAARNAEPMGEEADIKGAMLTPIDGETLPEGNAPAPLAEGLQAAEGEAAPKMRSMRKSRKPRRKLAEQGETPAATADVAPTPADVAPTPAAVAPTPAAATPVPEHPAPAAAATAEQTLAE
ncbi:MAG: ribonuclease III [Alloprevotella sp.]